MNVPCRREFPNTKCYLIAVADLERSSRAISEATFLDEIYADLDDDGPRLVYADWLIEQGDPLGELIALQCSANPDTPEARTRVNSLVRTHRKLWLGDLAKVLVHITFRRGFLASFALAQNAAAREAEWLRLAQSPLLRTVEEIHIGRGNKRFFALFASSPAAANLRVLDHVGTAETMAIANGPPRRIDTLSCDTLPAPALLADVFGSSPGLPQIERLVTGYDRPPQIMATRWQDLATRCARSPLPRLRKIDAIIPLVPRDTDAAPRLIATVEALLAIPLARLRIALGDMGVTVTVEDASSLRIELIEEPPAVLVALWDVLGRLGFARVTIADGSADVRALVASHFANAVY